MSAQTLATTLWDLKVAGEEVADMGRAHTSAAGQVSGVDPTTALQRPASIGWGSDGFASDYTSCRDAVVAMLRANSDCLHDSGRALVWCAEKLYAGADDEVRSWFDQLDRADPDHD